MITINEVEGETPPKALFALTVVLAVLTAVLVYLAIRQIDR